uniref:Uncharacterized protein n=1 Tax=Sphaerodactylus townsendi TaxID=933632 RepID=A0ACB8F152_9SAUR
MEEQSTLNYHLDLGPGRGLRKGFKVDFNGDHNEPDFFLIQVGSYMEIHGDGFHSNQEKVFEVGTQFQEHRTLVCMNANTKRQLPGTLAKATLRAPQQPHPIPAQAVLALDGLSEEASDSEISGELDCDPWPERMERQADPLQAKLMKGLVPDKDEEPGDQGSGDEKNALIPDRHDSSLGAMRSTSGGESVVSPYAWVPSRQVGRGARRLGGMRQLGSRSP